MRISAICSLDRRLYVSVDAGLLSFHGRLRRHPGTCPARGRAFRRRILLGRGFLGQFLFRREFVLWRFLVQWQFVLWRRGTFGQWIALRQRNELQRQFQRDAQQRWLCLIRLE